MKRDAKKITRKVVLLMSSGLLLISVLLYFSFAWYTKMASVIGTQFNIARWDINANYQDDDFKVKVYPYREIEPYDGVTTKNLAAPGTSGYFDALLTAKNSQVEVEFSLTLDKSSMSKEFQERIAFYYPETGADGTITIGADGNPILKEFKSATDVYHGKLDKKSGDEPDFESTVRIFWTWWYDYDQYIEKTTEEGKFEKTTPTEEQGEKIKVDLTEGKTPAEIHEMIENYTRMSLVNWRALSYEAQMDLLDEICLCDQADKALINKYLTPGSSSLTEEETARITELKGVDGKLNEITDAEWNEMDQDNWKSEYADKYLLNESTRDIIKEYLTNYKIYDKFDTTVGLDVEQYKNQMSATVKIAISGVRPVITLTPTPAP